MKKYFLNYGTPTNYFSSFKEKSLLSFQKIGDFDKYYSLDEHSIDAEYRKKFAHIFDQSRGAGYWLWKPHLIKRILSKMDYDDILFYADATIIQIQSLAPIFNFIADKNILMFRVNDGTGNDRMVTKRDAYVLMGCDNQSITSQYGASYLTIRKTELTEKIVTEWLAFCEDERILTDMPNTQDFPNYDVFIDHRHDQAVLSLLCKKYNQEPIFDITQYGNPYRTESWGQLLIHNR